MPKSSNRSRSQLVRRERERDEKRGNGRTPAQMSEDMKRHFAKRKRLERGDPMQIGAKRAAASKARAAERKVRSVVGPDEKLLDSLRIVLKRILVED